MYKSTELMATIIRVDPSFWLELINKGYNDKFQCKVLHLRAKRLDARHVVVDEESLNAGNGDGHSSNEPSLDICEVTMYSCANFPEQPNNMFIVLHDLSLKYLSVTFETSSAPKHTLSLKKYAPASLLKEQVFVNLSMMNKQLNNVFDLKGVANTSFLFCGSGTLTHQLSRNLLSWGVTKMGFIDIDKVKENNLLRQWLFSRADLGKCKAEATAESLRNVYKGIDTDFRGHKVTIPVPSDYGTFEEYLRLKKLIYEHDVIVLATDSRESRYVPTMLGKMFDKIVLTVAIGIDTLTVIRTKGQEACYFCQDVIGPHDSVSGVPSDMRCTKSRPSLAAMCGALAVENVIDFISQVGNPPAQIRSMGMSSFHFIDSVPSNVDCVCCSLVTNVKSYVHTDEQLLADNEEYNEICEIMRDPTRTQVSFDENELNILSDDSSE
jgi:molybdopterin/thiamine biosynthesis adenylyltransferase